MCMHIHLHARVYYEDIYVYVHVLCACMGIWTCLSIFALKCLSCPALCSGLLACFSSNWFFTGLAQSVGSCRFQLPKSPHGDAEADTSKDLS